MEEKEVKEERVVMEDQGGMEQESRPQEGLGEAAGLAEPEPMQGSQHGQRALSP